MWFVYVIGAALLWALMGLAYRKCALDMTAGERYVPIKFSIATGVVCVPIVAIYLLIREEDFSIWESFVRFYPFTIYMYDSVHDKFCRQHVQRGFCGESY